MSEAIKDNVEFTQRPLEVHKAFIAQFWQEFGAGGHRTFMSPKSKHDTLEELRRLGRVVLKYNGKSTADRREGFNRVKADRHNLSSHKHCFACRRITNTPARHHIIWLRNGGINSKRNMVTLCFECHAEVHPWLRAEYAKRRNDWLKSRGKG